MGVLLASARAAAQAPAEVQEAERLFYEGRDALDRKDYATACAKLGQSAALVPRPATLVNLAECEEHGGHVVAATQHLRQAVGLLDPRDERREPAEKRLAAVAARQALITVRVTGEHAAIAIDGAPFAQGSAETPIDPGHHVAVVSAPGRADARTELDLGEGERRRVDLAVGAAPVAPAAPAAPPRASTQRVAGFAIGAVGIAALGVAAVTGVVLLNRDKTIAAACNNGVCSHQDFQLVKGSRTLLVVNDIAWGVGAAGLIVGTILIATSPSSARKVDARFGPVPGGAAVAVGGTF
jgi:hypothetical protein